jgi:hypothetical protein
MAFSLFGFDLSGIVDTFRSFLGPLAKLFDSLKQGYDHLTTIFSAAETLRDSVLAEIEGWKNFKQDLRFAQRVVNLESAVQKTRDLIQGIPDSWNAIKDLISEFKKQLSGGETNPVEDAEAAAEDLESGGIKAFLQRFPKLAKAFEKVLGVVALVVQALEAIRNSIDDLQTIVDELKRLRLEVEKLDTIFLSQSNKRKTVKLADGSTMRLRLGKLH